MIIFSNLYFFWDFTHRRIVVFLSTFGTTYRSHFQWPSIPRKLLLDCLTPEDGTDCLLRSIAEETTILRCVKLQKSASLMCTVAETWNRALYVRIVFLLIRVLSRDFRDPTQIKKSIEQTSWNAYICSPHQGNRSPFLEAESSLPYSPDPTN